MHLNSLQDWSCAYVLNKLETIPDVPALLKKKKIPVKLPFTILIYITEVYLLFDRDFQNILLLHKK